VAAFCRARDVGGGGRAFSYDAPRRPALGSAQALPEPVDVYLELVVGTTLPVGTIVVEPLSLDDTRGPELYLGMEKTAEGWAYVQADADGRLLETHTGLCQRCHQEGVSDELFGPRRDLAPAPSSSP
jgi:hypothetical protein